MNRRVLITMLIALLTLVGLTLTAQAQDAQDPQQPPAQEAPAPDAAEQDSGTPETADPQTSEQQSKEEPQAPSGEAPADARDDAEEAASQDEVAEDEPADPAASDEESKEAPQAPSDDDAADDAAADDAPADQAPAEEAPAAAGADDRDPALPEASGSTLWLSGFGGFGEHLVTGEGLGVYVYTQDRQGESVCVDLCATNWPPLMAEGEPTLGEQVDERLVGTIERLDGGTQLTYDGMPLYTYSQDHTAADVNGQALGDQFFLVRSSGDRVTQQVETFQAVEVDEATMTTLLEDGEGAYAANCAVCHGDEGQGGIGPGLADNRLLADTTFLVGRILNGFPDHGMPAFRDQLNDHQIAAIATFIRNEWGNDFGAVTEEQVAEQR